MSKINLIFFGLCVCLFSSSISYSQAENNGNATVIICGCSFPMVGQCTTTAIEGSADVTCNCNCGCPSGYLQMGGDCLYNWDGGFDGFLDELCWIPGICTGEPPAPPDDVPDDDVFCDPDGNGITCLQEYENCLYDFNLTYQGCMEDLEEKHNSYCKKGFYPSQDNPPKIDWKPFLGGGCAGCIGSQGGFDIIKRMKACKNEWNNRDLAAKEDCEKILTKGGILCEYLKKDCSKDCFINERNTKIGITISNAIYSYEYGDRNPIFYKFKMNWLSSELKRGAKYFQKKKEFAESIRLYKLLTELYPYDEKNWIGLSKTYAFAGNKKYAKFYEYRLGTLTKLGFFEQKSSGEISTSRKK